MVHRGPHGAEPPWVHRSFVGSDHHVLIIHGALDRAAGMALIARCLRDHADVTWYDRRGYASRWNEPGPFTIEAHVAEALALLEGRPTIIVGHSLGGDIALAAAQQNPALVRGITVYETPLSWMDFWPKDTAGGTSVALGPDKGAEAFMIRMIGQSRWEALPERTRDARRREGRALVEEMTSLRSTAPWDVDAISCPVIVGRGEKAAAHHVRGAEWLAEHLPNGRLRVLEGAGHGAPISHPRQFVDELIVPHFDASGTFTVTS